MFIFQILTVVEVINPALGLVNTAIFPAMVQVIQSLVSLVCFLGLFTELTGFVCQTSTKQRNHAVM